MPFRRGFRGVRIPNMSSRSRVLRAVAFPLALGMAALASAQNPAPPPATALPNASASPAMAAATVLPNASASPAAGPPALDTKQALDNIGNLVKDGKIGVEADLQQGKLPVIPKYMLEVEGSPTTTVDVSATNGKVDNFKFGVKNGRLIVRGQGLRPRLWIEG